MSDSHLTAVRRWALAALLVALTLAATACGDDDSASASSGAADLDGKTFVSSDVEGHDLVKNTAVTLTFDGDQLGINAGCNTMNGEFTTDGDTLTLEEPVASTMMACGIDLEDQDAWVTSWLQGGVTWSLDGSTLTLEGDDVTMTLDAEDS